MSRTHLVGGLVASTLTLLVAAALAVRALPLQATLIEARPSNAMSVEDTAVTVGGEAQANAAQEPREALPRLSPAQTKIVTRVEPVYPPDAETKGQKGVVIVEARVDTAGRVTDARVLRSRGDIVDRAVIEAVRQWRFAPPATESLAVVSVRFDPVALKLSQQPKVLSRVDPVYPPEAKALGIKTNIIVEARVDTTGNVTDVRVLRVQSAVARDRGRDAVRLKEAYALLAKAATDAVRQWRFEPPAKETVAICTVRF